MNQLHQYHLLIDATEEVAVVLRQYGDITEPANFKIIDGMILLEYETFWVCCSLKEIEGDIELVFEIHNAEYEMVDTIEVPSSLYISTAVRHTMDSDGVISMLERVNFPFYRWHGYDFDGTLCHWDFEKWNVNTEHVGYPIEPMCKMFVEDEKARIFTARVSGMDGLVQRRILEDWCAEHLGCIPIISHRKDKHMNVLYDDRAYRVLHNKGIIVPEPPDKPILSGEMDVRRLVDRMGHEIVVYTQNSEKKPLHCFYESLDGYGCKVRVEVTITNETI